MEEITWITTNEAAELSGYHTNYLRWLIKHRRVVGRKFGPAWQVSKESLLMYFVAAAGSDDKRRGPRKQYRTNDLI